MPCIVAKMSFKERTKLTDIGSSTEVSFFPVVKKILNKVSVIAQSISYSRYLLKQFFPSD